MYAKDSLLQLSLTTSVLGMFMWIVDTSLEFKVISNKR